jgi:hypothetical protein
MAELLEQERANLKTINQQISIIILEMTWPWKNVLVDDAKIDGFYPCNN